MSKFYKKQEKKENVFLSKISFVYSTIKEKLSFLKWFDPFTYVDLWVMPKVKKITTNEYVEMFVNIFFALLFAWAIYTLLGLIFQTQTPLVIVYSASMENTFARGDVMALSKATEADDFGEVIFLNRSIKNVPSSQFVSPVFENSKLKELIFKESDSSSITVTPNTQGNVVVYSAYPSGLPIIHRAIVKIVANDGNFILTKGDNSFTNPTFDQDCGKINDAFNVSDKPCITFYPVSISELHGRTFFAIPKVGCVKLWLVDDLISLITVGSLPRDFKGIC